MLVVSKDIILNNPLFMNYIDNLEFYFIIGSRLELSEKQRIAKGLSHLELQRFLWFSILLYLTLDEKTTILPSNIERLYFSAYPKLGCIHRLTFDRYHFHLGDIINPVEYPKNTDIIMDGVNYYSKQYKLDKGKEELKKLLYDWVENNTSERYSFLLNKLLSFIHDDDFYYILTRDMLRDNGIWYITSKVPYVEISLCDMEKEINHSEIIKSILSANS